MIPAIIADDEPAATVVIQYLIEKSNMPIKIVGNATDGQMALNMIRSERPELVFLDIQMPLLNGFELISQEPHLKYIIIKLNILNLRLFIHPCTYTICCS